MTKIVISIRAEHDRRFLTASVRVSVSPPGAQEAQSPQSTAGGLGEGPLLPDSSVLPYHSDGFIINVESGFGTSFAQCKPPHDWSDVTPIRHSGGACCSDGAGGGTAALRESAYGGHLRQRRGTRR
jgi:hypothetical protein